MLIVHAEMCELADSLSNEHSGTSVCWASRIPKLISKYQFCFFPGVYLHDALIFSIKYRVCWPWALVCFAFLRRYYYLIKTTQQNIWDGPNVVTLAVNRICVIRLGLLSRERETSDMCASACLRLSCNLFVLLLFRLGMFIGFSLSLSRNFQSRTRTNLQETNI